jgi:hypothetical protein
MLEVVDRSQAVIEELFRVKEVRQIRAAVTRAALARAPFLDRGRVVPVAGVRDIETPGGHE